jgi:radical SAM superfamily enzyme YgiQ (UPF0313 family)
MAPPRVLLLIPPLTQLNTPYPSTAYLTGFLRSRGIECEQADVGIEMVLRLFTRSGLESVFEEIRRFATTLPGEARQMLAMEQAYLDAIDPIVEFLQGRNPTLASHLARPGVLPQGPRFAQRQSAVRSLSVLDRAKQSATLFLEDVTDLVQATVCPHFALNRYAEQIGRSASSFQRLLTALGEPLTLIDSFLLTSLRAHLKRTTPNLIGLSVPFPGNVYGAFRIAQAIKTVQPELPIVLGGGYVNTELRRVTDPRIFDFVDFLTLDDGEAPLLSIIHYLKGESDLCRTFHRKDDQVRFADDVRQSELGMNDVGCPTYDGLPLDRYLSIIDSTNPMHRLWSEGHWNKLTVAHGCYWKQCTFCDVGLNYISRYEMTPTDRLLDQIEQLIAETGRRGFHFVDEAAPPAALKSLALRLLEQGLTISWWGNIRFEEAFSPDLCRLLAASGCIAVTAGLEAASDRLLEKMKKGITVDQTALVAAAFRDAGVMVHAYLMYGFPSETIQETMDSLERVRQLFSAQLVKSAFWHRFTPTAHSPIGLNPQSHGLRLLGPEFEGFAENDLICADRVGDTPEWVGEGLRRSMLNYLEGNGLRLDVRRWFEHATPTPRVSSTWVEKLLRKKTAHDEPALERRLVWLGGTPVLEGTTKRCRLILPGRLADIAVVLPHDRAAWLDALIKGATPARKRLVPYQLLREAEASFPGDDNEWRDFLSGRVWRQARNAGLLLV